MSPNIIHLGQQKSIECKSEIPQICGLFIWFTLYGGQNFIQEQ